MGSRRPRRNNNNKKPPSWAFYLIYENSHKISWKHFRPLFCYIIILKICANIFLTWNPLNYQRNRVKSIFELVLAPRRPVWSDEKISFVSGLAYMSVFKIGTRSANDIRKDGFIFQVWGATPTHTALFRVVLPHTEASGKSLFRRSVFARVWCLTENFR